MRNSMDYKNKKVLILGLGLNEGGVGSSKFFASHGADVLVTDLKSKKELEPSIEKLKEFPYIRYSLGGHKNEDIDWADIVIRNQALKPTNPFLVYARKKGKEVKTDMGIFLEHVKKESIIGVTGTKGKSTTSSAIAYMLESAGKKVLLAGNIGKSVLDSIQFLTDDTLVVLEISSFQLEAFDANSLSPRYSIITNIYPDHLNYYETMANYINAKKIIGLHQTPHDYLFLNKDNEILDSESFLKNLNGKIIFYSKSDLPDKFSPQIPGEFNLTNLAAAFALSKILGLDQTTSLESLANFKGVKYRMELIKQWHGIKIYNNTTATAPEPAIESLKTFPGCILIAGGMNKGLAYEEFAKAIAKHAKSVYFLEGNATDEILNHLKNLKSQISNLKPYNSLETLLTDVKSEAKEGDTIVFAPGATSFNLFQNEFDRGEKFNTAVDKIFS